MENLSESSASIGEKWLLLLKYGADRATKDMNHFLYTRPFDSLNKFKIGDKKKFELKKPWASTQPNFGSKIFFVPDFGFIRGVERSGIKKMVHALRCPIGPIF